MDNPNEIWRPFPGYSGLYELSNLGRVRSLPHTVEVKTTGRYGTPHIAVHNYKGKVLAVNYSGRNKSSPCVCLSKDGRTKTVYLGRDLIDEVFK